MNFIIETLKAILFGLVEGITEWLPISSTGHMILLDEFVKMNVSAEFWKLFLVVIQLGAIMAVVLIYFRKIFPFNFNKAKGPFIKKDIFVLWFKILVACIPAAVVGILFDDFLDKYLYNSYVVATMLIIFGVGFIYIESKKHETRVGTLKELTYKDAMIIGLFQLIAAIFPGTSRSGATILGALMIGISRKVAAEFTFFLAIPVMFGASLLKIIKIGFAFTMIEYWILFVGMLVAFVVSVLVIKFLMSYIKKHDFKIFGYYRIILGILVFVYFLMK
ncbi:MAG: undecaprenyl-diphosphate phosphatase [Erysipelotrichaceae bacterium]|nr:undecaprenyl-diphosphate phosphatase [Erysipelotrichaceae bacterium]